MDHIIKNLVFLNFLSISFFFLNKKREDLDPETLADNSTLLELNNIILFRWYLPLFFHIYVSDSSFSFRIITHIFS